MLCVAWVEELHKGLNLVFRAEDVGADKRIAPGLPDMDLPSPAWLW